ncbi:MAG: methyl-accepting chemotaxis protein, partial [Rhodobacteraceae bacterium]|nr:methyl-accepting chemotaxis protein [Paracoccaceae bacterium]
LPGRSAAIIDGGFSPVHDRDGKLIKVLLMGSDVTAAQQVIAEAEQRRKSMEKAQNQVVEALRIGLSALSAGNLAARIEEGFAPDYETVRKEFNNAADRLADALAQVMAHSETIKEEVREIAHASDDLSRRTEVQAATLEQTAAALDQLTVSVRSAAQGAAEANGMVAQARGSAHASAKIVQEAVTAMGEIERSSEKIARIIGVIDDIAFQTNLLALNAGVEAARAGEAGRGFAVVANEVRALAQKSSDAARQIDELISGATAEVKRGVGLVDQTGRVLNDILASVENIASRMADIATSAQEQSAGLAEINGAVNRIDHTTQENAVLFAQTLVTGRRLQAGAESLARTMGRFALPVAVAAEAHKLEMDRASVPHQKGQGSVSHGHERGARLALACNPSPYHAPDDWDAF